jgi:DNA-directed RNA polymerase specialized sigma24 family protein
VAHNSKRKGLQRRRAPQRLQTREERLKPIFAADDERRRFFENASDKEREKEVERLKELYGDRKFWPEIERSVRLSGIEWQIPAELLDLEGQTNPESFHRKLEEIIEDWLEKNPKLAGQIFKYQHLFIYPMAVNLFFKLYGLDDNTFTKLYLDWLTTLRKEAVMDLKKKEGEPALKSSAGLALVEVSQKIAREGALYIKNLRSYIERTFTNNVLKDLYQGDSSLPDVPNAQTAWGAKISRRKQLVENFQEEMDRKQQEEINNASTSERAPVVDLAKIQCLPEGRLRKVVTLRYGRDLTIENTAKELNVNEKTIRRDCKKILEILKKPPV